MVNVGKYISPMDLMGNICKSKDHFGDVFGECFGAGFGDGKSRGLDWFFGDPVSTVFWGIKTGHDQNAIWLDFFLFSSNV